LKAAEAASGADARGRWLADEERWECEEKGKGKGKA